MKRDQAAKIAEKEYPVDKWSSTEERRYAVSMRPTLEKRIRRAITAAVRKERERCVGIVQQSRGTGEMGEYERAYMCDAIAEKIRKGKA